MSARSARVVTAALALLALVAISLPALAQPAPATPAPGTGDRPSPPFAPEWAQLAGWEVFTKKDCGKCHAIRGIGGKVGPDLARLKGNTSFFDIGADLWNHLPKMGARMRAAGIERATLTPAEASNLIAFLFTAQYADESGDAASGAKLFAAKGCVTCHAVGGKGGHVGPALDHTKRANSPVIVAAAMFDHGARMTEIMKQKGIARPTLEGRELLDIIAYVQSVSTDTGETQQVVPGTPERGRKIFTEKHCVACHAVGGKGGHVGPDLGTPGHHVSLTDFAARMWNHEPGMLAKMAERKIPVPNLSGQEMADVLAYLYVSRFFEADGNPDRGAAALSAKGCLGCHSVRGKGEKIGADLARSTFARTPQGLVAGLWNHSRFMERAAEKRAVALPTLTGRELADLSAYLVKVAGRGAAKPAAPRPPAK